MKQIYDFEQYHPPVLNESMIRMELENQRLKREMKLFVLAGILIQASIILFGICMAQIDPAITIFCFLFTGAMSGCSGIIALVYIRKGDVSYE